jgi:hypothetical protein
MRCVGDLGEIAFNDWLKTNPIAEFQWHLDNAAGKSDFTVLRIGSEVKTMKRKAPLRVNPRGIAYWDKLF